MLIKVDWLMLSIVRSEMIHEMRGACDEMVILSISLSQTKSKVKQNEV